MATRNIVPRANEEGNIGTNLKNWLKGWFKNLFVSGEITDGNSGIAVTVLDLNDAVDKKHNSYLLGTKTLDEANIADLKILQYKSSSGKIEYITLPGGGDMLKSVYDTGDNGIVDNSEKLESSTKAQVQDHSPKAHTHVEVDITDLDHYDSAGFTTDFASENLANLGTKSYNDLTNRPDLSDLHNHINKLLLDTYDQTNVDISDAVTHKDLTTNPHSITVDQLDLASGTIASDIDDAVTKKHNHSNKTLLDTYTQTEVDIADVISKEHIHGNLTLLETYTQIEADLASAVSLKHSNSLDHTQNSDTDLDATFEATFVKKVDNVNVLADITSPGANIEDAVTKRHSHVNQPSCKAYQSSAQSISSASYTSVVLDAEDFDVGSMHDNVTNNTRITIQAGQAGTYLIIGQVSFASNSSGYRRCQIRLNGTTTIANDRNSAISGTATTVDASTIEQLSVGDYVEMRAYQNSGGSRNLLTGKEDTFFSVHKLS